MYDYVDLKEALYSRSGRYMCKKIGRPKQLYGRAKLKMTGHIGPCSQYFGSAIHHICLTQYIGRTFIDVMSRHGHASWPWQCGLAMFYEYS